MINITCRDRQTDLVFDWELIDKEVTEWIRLIGILILSNINDDRKAIGTYNLGRQNG